MIADKGFAGAEFEALMRELGAIFRRPDRKDEPARFGGLGGVRQWIESVFDTFKGQLSLERHGAHTMPGLITRIAQRLLALAAGLWHNWNIGQPGRHLTAYDHKHTDGISHLVPGRPFCGQLRPHTRCVATDVGQPVHCLETLEPLWSPGAATTGMS